MNSTGRAADSRYVLPQFLAFLLTTRRMWNFPCLDLSIESWELWGNQAQTPRCARFRASCDPRSEGTKHVFKMMDFYLKWSILKGSRAGRVGLGRGGLSTSGASNRRLGSQRHTSAGAYFALEMMTFVLEMMNFVLTWWNLYFKSQQWEDKLQAIKVMNIFIPFKMTDLY